MEEVELGPWHAAHRTIPWQNKQWENAYPITLPRSFLNLLRYNNPITRQDSLVVNEVLEKTREKTDQNELEILDLRKKMARLKYQLERSKKKAFACSTILSPFRRLPPDILRQIASHCAPVGSLSDHWGTDSDTPPMRHMPSILASTSWAWREVVCDMSFLWCVIPIQCNQSIRRWDERYECMLKSRVNRFSELAKSLPLTFVIDESPTYVQGTLDGDIEDSDDAAYVMNLLLYTWAGEHQNRIQTLAIQPKSARGVYELVDLLLIEGVCLPSVQTLVIKEMRIGEGLNDLFPQFGSVPEILSIVDLFPNMRQLWFGHQAHRMSPVLGLSTPVDLYSKCKELTSICIVGTIAMQDYCMMLQFCPNLKLASFAVSTGTSASIPSHSFLHIHHQLKQLFIVFRYCESMHILQPFAGFLFPALELLRLNFQDVRLDLYHDDPPLVLQPQNFVHTFPSLQTLVIGESNATLRKWHGILPLFSAIPSVTTIWTYINNKIHLYSLLEFFLNTSGAHQHALPNLKLLHAVIGFRRDKGDIDELEKGILGVLYQDLIFATSMGYTNSGKAVAAGSAPHSGDMTTEHNSMQSNTTNGTSQHKPTLIQFQVVSNPYRNQKEDARDPDLPSSYLQARKENLEALVGNYDMDIQFQLESPNGNSPLVPGGMYDVPVEEYVLQQF